MVKALSGALLVGLQLCAQGAAYLRERYTKREVMVPMRDGTRLFTAIYAPKAKGRFPVLLERTPYGASPYGPSAFPDVLGPSRRFGQEGFIFVTQDVRGRMMSEGSFVNLRPALPAHGAPDQVDESTDTYDTVEWLLRHLPTNGRVGQWGISYPAFYAATALQGAHPAMRAVSPQAPIMDWFQGDDFHRNGAFWLPHAFHFLSFFGPVRPEPTTRMPPPLDPGTRDGYAFFLAMGPLANADALHFKGAIPFWTELMAHGTYDAFWQERDLRRRLKGVKPAVLTVGGWFDAENLFGSLQLHRTLDRKSPGNDHRLVMGPWQHGEWNGPWGGLAASHFQATMEFPFFMHHLKGAPDPRLPAASVFDTGAGRWRAMDRWPPRARGRKLYLQPGGRLDFRRHPLEAWASFPSDPAHPVPYLDWRHPGMDAGYMRADQRFASHRPDVLTFHTEVLAEDLTLAGPLQAELWVSTTGTDADWVVKVMDGHPEKDGGREALVRGEVMRGKFRRGLERPVPFVPGEPDRVAFALNDVFHTFRKGHRVVVQIQSSWFPLMDRNPQTFTDIYGARPEDFRAAEHRVCLGGDRASRLVLPVLEGPTAPDGPDAPRR
jgi:putative CocE/NonD family hydrolase